MESLACNSHDVSYWQYVLTLSSAPPLLHSTGITLKTHLKSTENANDFQWQQNSKLLLNMPKKADIYEKNATKSNKDRTCHPINISF